MLNRGPLSDKIKINWVSDYAASNNSAVNTSSVDMTEDGGYEGVMFIAKLGTANANNTLNGAQSSDDATFADLEGTSVSSGSSDEIVWLDIYRPSDRYVRAELDRTGANTTVNSVVAIRYGPRTLPTDNTVTGTITGESHVDPDEGTA